MPKKVPLDASKIEWLRQASSTGVPIPIMARQIGCCTDTLKRILMRHGFAEFHGAKYLPSRRHEAPSSTWTRRCLSCRQTKELPKNKYICGACKVRHGVADPDEVAA